MSRMFSVAVVGLCAFVSTAVSTAYAAVAPTVVQCESLWSIPATERVGPRSLGAYGSLAAIVQRQPGATTNVSTANLATRTVAAGGAPADSRTAPIGARLHRVRWGETLSGIAARAGVSMEELARFNGLNPTRPLLAGTVLRLPAPSTGGTSAPT